MAKKAESRLPKELNENWGSNYMMDGFNFDMDYGAGVEDSQGKQLLPQPPQSGFSKLPDGLVIGEGGGNLDMPDSVFSDDEATFDLGELGITESVELDPNEPGLEDLMRQASLVVRPDNDREDAGIVDLTWLAGAYQDPERLPSDPTSNMVEELQKCWGDRTDGIYRIDLKDREELRYEDAYQGSEDDDVLNADKLGKLIQSAMRKSAAGKSLSEIVESIRQQVTPAEARHIAKAVQAVKAEHGLVGNVYVRASAYPGLHRGKWSKQFAKAARNARYLIACDGEDCSACACAAGLQEISSTNEIDWNETFEHYAPRLANMGQLKQASQDKRETLRRAFLRRGKAPKSYTETPKFRHTIAADLVTKEQAEATLRAYRPGPQEVVTLASKFRAEEFKRVEAKVWSWAKQGLLTSEEVRSLVAKRLKPSTLLKQAADLIVGRVQKTTYHGEGEGRLPKESRMAYLEAKDALSRIRPDKSFESMLRRRAMQHLQQERKSALSTMHRMVEAGVLTQQDYDRLSHHSDTSDMLKAASTIASGKEDILSLLRKGARPDPSPVEEFALHNAALDEIDYDDNEDPGSLQGISFGGFEV